MINNPMTFREKYELDHPDDELDPCHMCPSMFGYEPEGGCANTLHETDVPRICGECWNREMPGTEEKPRIKDSGERRQFETGAVRDIQDGKGRCDLMPLSVVYDHLKFYDGNSGKVLEYIGAFQKHGETHFLHEAIRLFVVKHSDWRSVYDMFLEVAKHFEEGAKKYGENNWQKGLPVHCYIDSAVRHYLKWLRGDKDEPHDRAFVWNLLCCIWECDFSPRAKEKSND